MRLLFSPLVYSKIAMRYIVGQREQFHVIVLFFYQHPTCGPRWCGVFIGPSIFL